MMAVRSVGAVVMAVGGRHRSPALLVAGSGLVALGWSHGLLVRRPVRIAAGDP
jgi:hypothetical protein